MCFWLFLKNLLPGYSFLFGWNYNPDNNATVGYLVTLLLGFDNRQLHLNELVDLNYYDITANDCENTPKRKIIAFLNFIAHMPFLNPQGTTWVCMPCFVHPCARLLFYNPCQTKCGHKLNECMTSHECMNSFDCSCCLTLKSSKYFTNKICLPLVCFAQINW